MTTMRTTSLGADLIEETRASGSSGLGGALPVSPTEIREAMDSVARSVPDVARSSKSLMEDAMMGIERSSDERIAAGVTLSLGLAVGMLIGGAPRILTVLALIPVAAFGLVLMDRRSAVAVPKPARSVG